MMPRSNVIIITGANSGIGFRAAQMLCRDGYDVILACRSQERGQAAVEKIKREIPSAQATLMLLDLASTASIRRFVAEFQSKGKPLNVLVNNAGVAVKYDRAKQYMEKDRTQDGFELTMGTNHLGHFLLTNLLLEDLTRTAQEYGEARIVTTSSLLHDSIFGTRMNGGREPNPIDYDDLNMDKPGAFTSTQAYKNSKAANIMFTYQLAARLRGTGVTATCLCPGWIPETGLMRHNESCGLCFAVCYVKYFCCCLRLTRTVGQGAGLIVELAVHPKHKGITGKYFKDFREMETSAETRNEQNQIRLWEVSERLSQIR